ncbi:MAG: allantoinase PuuE [Sneathiellaceae bacterium]
MTGSYPRDMVGYGRHTPDPKWPGGARLALSFVMNYEEGGEMNILHGDSASESYLTEIVGVPPLPGARNGAVESMYEFGSRAGFWRLHRMFTQRQMPLTVYAVTMAMERNPDAVAGMVEAGWEIASHGYRWIDYSGMPEAEERAQLERTVEVHRRMTGERPVGWYCGRHSVNTRRLVAEEAGFLYDSDDYSDDLPYWTEAAGKPYLILPYGLDANDFRYAMPQGFNAGEQFYSYCRDSFDYLYAEGATAPKMLSIGLHCRISGRPGRAAALARFLDYVQGHGDVWVTTRAEIARHWRAQFPPGG